jgi:very-short-patch-repair endonuclease
VEGGSILEVKKENINFHKTNNSNSTDEKPLISKCEATTKFGVQCTNYKKEGYTFCGKHLKVNSLNLAMGRTRKIPILKNSNTTKKCEALNKHKMPCSHFSKDGEKFCVHHLKAQKIKSLNVDISLEDFIKDQSSKYKSSGEVKICTPKQVGMCKNINCEICFKRSFASHIRSLDWDTRNLQHPRDIYKTAQIAYDFYCKECFHWFSMSISHVCRNHWCGFCSNQNLCYNPNCKTCFNKSFASSNRAIHWSPNNPLKPRNYFKASAYEAEFKCDVCYHYFTTSLHSINNGNSWCPYCCISPKELCDDLDCKQCRDKSFELSDKAKYWSFKNQLKPREVFKCSKDKYIFDCPECSNEYISSPDEIFRGNWCGCTKFKTAKKLYDWLILNYNIEIKREKSFEWCKNITYLLFDFCIEEYKLIIELDGLQHFFQVRNWKSPEEAQKWDKYKTDCANGNGYSIIRIFQPDVWENKNNWEINLRNAIKKYEIPTNVMISDIYKNHPIYFR